MDRTKAKISQSLLTSSPTKEKLMALKLKFNSKEEVPAGLTEHYVERDGAFVLDVEGVVDRARMEEVRAHNANLMREREGLTARLSAVQIDQGMTAAATKRGLRSTAIQDITARARGVFKLVEGAPVALEADGKTVRMGKDGAAPLSLEEWVDQQVTQAREWKLRGW